RGACGEELGSARGGERQSRWRRRRAHQAPRFAGVDRGHPRTVACARGARRRERAAGDPAPRAWSGASSRGHARSGVRRHRRPRADRQGSGRGGRPASGAPLRRAEARDRTMTVLRLLGGTLLLRPYVFVFLAVYLFAAVSKMGWPKTLAFTLVAWAIAYAAEFTSTRTGFPFGLYVYVDATRGRELWLSNVPFF